MNTSREATRPGKAVATSIDASARWLVGVSILCVLLVFGVRAYFGDLENDIKLRGANERARLFIGEEIVRGIQGVEKDIYRLAVTQNAAGFARVNAELTRQLRKLNSDLNVLKSGGTSQRLMQLNIDGQDEVTREAHFTPDSENQSVVMEAIEIEPLLGQVKERVLALEQLLLRRWQNIDQEDGKAFYQTEGEIVLLLKQIPPQFERLNENANRLFLEGDQRLRALESELEGRTRKLQQIETGLISLVVLLGGLLAVIFMRRLTAALQEAHLARDDAEHQREQNATILDTLGEGLYATDMNGNMTFINAAGEQILGWPATELVGQQSHRAVHHSRPGGDPFPQDECPLIAVLQKGISLDGEDHFVSRDGRFIPVAYRSKPLKQDGQVVGSLVSFHDISERLDSEARIRLQQAALDAAANMIVITNRDGLIEYVNPAFSQTTGYSLDEALGQPTSLLNSGLHDRAFYAAMWNGLLAGKSWEGELNNRRKNGEIYPEQMTITPIFEADRITHFIAIKRDISEEVKTRTQLKLVETAIQDIDQGIHIMEAVPHVLGPRIQYVNAGFSRITGYPAQEVIGERASVMQGPDPDPVKLLKIQQAMAQGISLTLEMNYQRKDGTPYFGELHLSAVHADNGQVSHYIGLVSDIGPRKEAEIALRNARDQALENSRLKSEFLSNMSHEIRTPMNGIIGMTDLLLDTELDPEQRDFTSIVRDSAQALLVIINDILDFSKIEAGKLDIEITEFSGSQVVEGTVELLGTKAREKSLTLTSFVDPALPACLLGDPTRVRQVLLNLISNAIKFTDHGGIEVSALAVTQGDAGFVRFEVTDTGIGISPQTQAKLFQSFTQADSSTTRKYGGTGLGLAICKRLVELMDGHIGVNSQAGAGSSFWFTLPLKPCLASKPAQLAQTHHADGTPLQRVLVVDDHASDRKVIHRYLNSWSMPNDGASNAQEALKLLQDAIEVGVPYQVALVDLVMPGMDGLELAHTLRADKQFDGLRLVLMSAHDQRDLDQRAREAGFAAFLGKPVRQSQLYESLQDQDPPASVPVLEDKHLDLLAAPRVPITHEHRRLILLAEDNLVNQKVAQLQIEKLGYALHIVDNGQQALDALAASTHGTHAEFAAILMDCQMPVLDGFEATAAIRQAEQSGTRRMPIIAMTANAMQGDRERCLAAGMDDYLSKPIQADQLRLSLEKWAGSAVADSASDITPPTRFDDIFLDSASVVNFEMLNDYFGDDPQTLAKLLALFQSTTSALLAKMGAAVEARDASEVCSLAHELKGTCGNIGMDRMAGLATHLETTANALDWRAVDELHVAIRSAFDAVLGVIERTS